MLLGFVVPNPAWSPCKDACSHPKMHSWRDFSCCVGWKIEGRKERELRLAFERSALEVKLARQNNQNCVTYFPISSPRGVAAAVAAAAYGPATTQMPGFARPCSPLKGKAAATRSCTAMEKRQFLCLDFDPSCMESCFLLHDELADPTVAAVLNICFVIFLLDICW